MQIQKTFEVEGRIVENLPNTTFKVQVGERTVLCHLSGKMRIHFVRLLPGDKVLVAMLTPNETLGRILARIK